MFTQHLGCPVFAVRDLVVTGVWGFVLSDLMGADEFSRVRGATSRENCIARLTTYLNEPTMVGERAPLLPLSDPLN